MSLAIKIKNRTAWLIRKTKKYSKKVYDHFFGLEEKDAQTNILPDPIYIKKLYKAKMGVDLDLKHPKTFNEKIQWLKLYDRKPIYTTMVDKYDVKKYVADMIGEEYVIPTLGVWDKFDDIDFESLPDRFVLKCTHDSGGVYICKDKTTLNVDSLRDFFKERMSKNYYKHGREWPYKNVKPRIIAEKYLMSKNQNGLIDYKIFSFNGTPKVILVCSDRETDLKETWYNEKFERLDIVEGGHSIDYSIVKPNKLDEMIMLSRKISKNIPFVRTDFYIIDNRVYFGEITLFPASGFEKFEPEEWDRKLGDMIHLPCDKK